MEITKGFDFSEIEGTSSLVNSEAQIPRFGSEWNEYFKATYGEENVSWVSNKLKLSDKARQLFRQGKFRDAMDVHYEDLIRAKTGGVSTYYGPYEIDAVTDAAGTVHLPRCFLSAIIIENRKD